MINQPNPELGCRISSTRTASIFFLRVASVSLELDLMAQAVREDVANGLVCIVFVHPHGEDEHEEGTLLDENQGSWYRWKSASFALMDFTH